MNAAKALKISWDLGENKNVSSEDIRNESIKLQRILQQDFYGF